MTNPKGTRWETAVVNYMNEANLHAERTGSELLDEGDIHFGVVMSGGEWTIEAKDHQEITLPAYLTQLEASLVRRDAIPFKAAAVVKNRRHGVGDAYAVMRFERWRQLVAYTVMLELVVLDYTGLSLPHPSELRRFLRESMRFGQNAHLIPVFGEVAGETTEVEVLADGTEVPAGAEGEVCPCGKVHTAEERAEAEAFIRMLLGVDVEFDDETENGAAPADDSPVAEWERDLLAGTVDTRPAE